MKSVSPIIDSFRNGSHGNRGCVACGAHGVWSAPRQKMVCASCATECPEQPDLTAEKTATIELWKILPDSELTDETVHVARREVQCHTCRGVVVFDENIAGRACDFCGATLIVFDEVTRGAATPNAVLPFRLDGNDARARFAAWLPEQVLTPGNLAKRSRVHEVRSRYIPYWAFDTYVRCFWEAESGHHREEEIEVRNSKGERETQTVTVTDWRPASGVYENTFKDEPVPGTRSIALDLLRKLEPFPTSEAVPYDTAFLSGFTVAHPTVPLAAAAKEWYANMWTKLTKLCGEEVPGDTHRNLQIETSYKGQACKLVLVPLWVVTYRYGNRSFEALVDGYTGKVSGDAPLSAWKVTLVLLLAALALGLALWLVVRLVATG